MAGIAENLAEIRGKIAEAAKLCGRNENAVRLLAVSKTFPAEDVAEAFAAGQIMFGENRVQELETKVPVLPDTIEWHLIGHLQSNKAAKAAALAQWVHSVDSLKLVNKLEAACPAGKELNILLEVNWTGEASKSGIRAGQEVFAIAEAALKTRNLKLRGLMTIAEADADEARLRQTFAGVRELRDKLEREFGCSLPELSMGMSADFREAVLEGATMVRVGSAIFGHRDYGITQ